MRRAQSVQTRNGDIEQSVCDATERLLSTHRFADLSVADILGEAGVSRASFYFYFASKYALLSAVSERAVDEVYAVTQTWLHRAESEPPLDALRTAMRGAVSRWSAHGPVLRAIVESSPSAPEIDAQWKRLIARFTAAAAEQIERERAAGVAPAGVDAHALGTMLTWMTERALYLMVSSGEPGFADADVLVETLAGVWWRAIYGAEPDGTGASSGLLHSA
jgi:AcrR family transcriptional regulator